MMPVPPLVFIHPYSVEMLAGPMNATGNAITSMASGAWPSANRAIFLPFTLYQKTTIKRLWLHNGSTVNGNVDMGIYDPGGNLLVSIGSTAQSGTSTLQSFNITDTTIGPGTFFVALAFDGATGTAFRSNSYTGDVLGRMGVYQMASAFPLPATATFATPASTYLPLCGLATRDLV